MKFNKFFLLGIFGFMISCGEESNDKVFISDDKKEESSGLTAEDFQNIDPNNPSFVSIDDTTPSDKKWVKVDGMSDEFSSLDLENEKKWFRSDWDYPVPVSMVKTGSENIGIEDGKLWIRATLKEGATKWFQSTRLHSTEHISYPMYTEASIKAAHISAYNTFWLNNGNSEDRDEIDIIENNSKPSCGCQPEFPTLMKSQYFHVDSSLTPNETRNADDFNSNKLSVNNPKRGVPWNEDYHTFGVWWKDSQNIQFYLDGEPAGAVTVGEQRDDAPFIDNREFTRDLQIIFDLWTNEAEWLGGLPPKEELKNNSINTMRVDWVRTWKLEDK